MRPIKLTMCGFGPYAAKEEIDFEKLGENGVYLITGVTGAGKTTIFDAVSYALFGEASGNQRKKSMLRSQYAELGTPTYAELVFEYRGVRYTVRRNPEYERKKDRGEGITTENASATLLCPGGKIYSGESDVTKAIAAIMGIDRNQFAQIAMIAQGDFLKLLVAKTPERIAILRHIFKTEKFETLQTRIKEEATAAEQTVKTLTEAFWTTAYSLACSPAHPLYSDVQKVYARALAPADVIPLAEKLKADDLARDEALKGELASAEKAVLENEKRLQRAKELEEKRSALLSLQKRQEALEEKKKACAAAALLAHSEEKTVSSLADEIARLNAEAGLYDELEAHKKKRSELFAEIERGTLQLDTLEREQTAMGEKIRKMQEEALSLQSAGEARERLEGERKEKTKRLELLSALKEESGRLSSEKEALKKAQDEYIAAEKKQTAALKYYNERSQAFLGSMAGVLAEELVENMPCPVCGSTEHPSPARRSESAPTEKEVEQAKSAWESADRLRGEASARAMRLIATAEEKGAQLLKRAKELFGEISEEEIPSRVKEEGERTAEALASLKKQIASEEERCARRKELESALPEAQEKEKEKRGSISSLREHLTEKRTEYAQIDMQAESALKKLKFKSKAEAAEEKQRLIAKKTGLEKAMEEADGALHTCEKEIAECRGSSEELKKQLSSAGALDLNALQEENLLLTARKQQLASEKEAAHHALETNRNIPAALSSYEKKLSAAEERSALIGTLSSTMNGTFTGKEKVMLETYIQMNYFDRIIRRANNRLRVMSDGQYELMRKETPANMRGQSGLDLDIIDHNNGSKRDVASLSGGESFKAALCLALGLSDEIQMSAGGIKLDTMFVDEGFGSLDPQSLSLAMNALIGLGESNRLVGIISHVAALQERIDRQIVIEKDSMGISHASIKV